MTSSRSAPSACRLSSKLTSAPHTQQIVTRLAPTPSGYLHIGNIFAFLVAWLDARQQQGRVILRIEDLDKPRCKDHLVDTMVHDLECLGLTWDNEHLMYQSKRAEAYEEAQERLSQLGLLYPCFCSRADLMASSAPHEGEHFVYAGTCKGIGEELRASRMATELYSIRLSVPGMEIRFDDAFQGSYSQQLASECGDFIIRRKDGLFGYQLAVVVDDIEQGVNRIIRGVDLLSSTPQQMYLRTLLTKVSSANDLEDEASFANLVNAGFDDMSFGHSPLIMDKDSNRLAKRKGSKGLNSLLETFKSVEALLGYLACETGLISSSDPITADELVKEADLSKLRGKKHVRINDID